MKKAFLQKFYLLLRIGSDPADTDEVRLSKYVIVVGFTAAAIMNFCFTGPLYLYFDEVPAGLNYMIHPVLSMINVAWFAYHHDHRRLDRVMAALTVLSNTLSVIFLGDFINSGAAALWGLCYPTIGMIIFYDLAGASGGRCRCWAISPCAPSMAICCAPRSTFPTWSSRRSCSPT
jgi:hypothetical protein